MNIVMTFEEHYARAPFAGYVRERRAGGVAPITLYDIVQPPGDHSDPPVSDLLLCFSRSTHQSRLRVGGERWVGRTTPGDLAIVAPGVQTEVLIDDPNAFLVVSLPGVRARLMLEQLRSSGDPFDFGRLHRGDTKIDFATSLAERAWRAAGESPSQLYCDALVLALLGELRFSEGAHRPSARGGLASWQERRCLEYLRTNLADDVDLPTLAGVANLSPFHFARMFKKTVGVPPHRYQLLLRLERAKELLLSTEMSVLEIALAVGYDAPQTLARLFRREMGVTPSAWRRERRS